MLRTISFFFGAMALVGCSEDPGPTRIVSGGSAFATLGLDTPPAVYRFDCSVEGGCLFRVSARAEPLCVLDPDTPECTGDGVPPETLVRVDVEALADGTSQGGAVGITTRPDEAIRPLERDFEVARGAHEVTFQRQEGVRADISVELGFGLWSVADGSVVVPEGRE